MSTPKFPDKDPDEVLDYILDWTSRLESDTILSSQWFIDVNSESPLVIDDDDISVDFKKTVVWLSSGQSGFSFTLRNRIITNGGRTMEQSVKLKVKER